MQQCSAGGGFALLCVFKRELLVKGWRGHRQRRGCVLVFVQLLTGWVFVVTSLARALRSPLVLLIDAEEVALFRCDPLVRAAFRNFERARLFVFLF